MGRDEGTKRLEKEVRNHTVKKARRRKDFDYDFLLSSGHFKQAIKIDDFGATETVKKIINL